jgi:hypothetical protein
MRIFAKSGHASKGFTLALRTASIAERHYLQPVLLKVLHGIAVILLDQTEYEAAKELCEAALPKVRPACHCLLALRHSAQRILTFRARSWNRMTWNSAPSSS